MKSKKFKRPPFKYYWDKRSLLNSAKMLEDNFFNIRLLINY
jgi:hypothetical protein